MKVPTGLPRCTPEQPGPETPECTYIYTQLQVMTVGSLETPDNKGAGSETFLGVKEAVQRLRVLAAAVERTQV